MLSKCSMLPWQPDSAAARPKSGEATLPQVASLQSEFLLTTHETGIEEAARAFALFPQMHIPLSAAELRVQTVHRPLEVSSWSFINLSMPILSKRSLRTKTIFHEATSHPSVDSPPTLLLGYDRMRSKLLVPPLPWGHQLSFQKHK
jgi:hypothetical protein